MLGAVGRKLNTREREGATVRVVYDSRTYATSTADLCNALTYTERVARWFSPVTGDVRLGGHYQIQGNASGTIARCEPEPGFGLTWEFGGQISWVDVTLTREGNETRLQLEHSAPCV